MTHHPTTSPSQLELHEVLSAVASEHRVPGMVAGLLVDGDLHIATTGMSRVADGVAIRPDTAFQVASVTKLFTTTAALQLVERGMLDLDRPLIDQGISIPLADHPTRERLSLRHLLSHQGGFESGRLHESGRTYGDGDGALGRMIADFGRLTQWTWPGQTYCYSNHGFDLVGYVIEAVTGRSFEDQVRRQVLAPIGHADAGFLHEALSSRTRATGHQLGHDGEPVPVAPGAVRARSAHPSAGLVSSAETLLTFAAAILGTSSTGSPSLLSSEMVAQMWTPITGGDDLGQHHGLGWSVHETSNGRVMGHTGTNPGYKSVFTIVPDQRAALVLLGNTDGDEAVRAMEDWILRTWLGIDDKFPVPEGVALSAVQIERVVGRYGDPDTMQWEIRRESSELILVRASADAASSASGLRLQPIDPLRFRVVDGVGRFRHRAIDIACVPDASREGRPALFLHLGQSLHRQNGSV